MEHKNELFEKLNRDTIYYETLLKLNMPGQIYANDSSTSGKRTDASMVTLGIKNGLKAICNNYCKSSIFLSVLS